MREFPIRSLPLALIFSLLCTSLVFSQSQNDRPKLNQLGFYPNSVKLAVSPIQSADEFHIRDVSDNTIVFTGSLIEADHYPLTGEQIKVADFSDLKLAGEYQLYIDGGPASYPFEIKNEVFDSLNSGLIKAMYFNRASIALDQQYAGPWHRPAGHPDTEVVIHPSAASEGRPANSMITSPGGWYDAGDFNKYVVPITSSIHHMLFAYEQFPDYFAGKDLNIPESVNDLPDILDENLYALRWLLTMQDPFDGGVYNKLTHPNFQPTVMPDEASTERYVVQKGTAATLDFAAVMAQASRVFRPFLPDFADSALSAAERAYDWAENNPNMQYDQNAMNANYDPDIGTGAYGDSNFGDEFFWASSELYITTGNESYYNSGGWSNVSNSGWGNVQALGLFSLLHHRQDLTGAALADTTSMKNTLVNRFGWYADRGAQSPYRSPFGIESWQFNWGSNGGAGNLGMALMMVYQVTGDAKYYNAGIHIMDYLMGRNGVGYSYVTGFGDQTPMHIHHRQSEADDVTDPVPGWVAGGANPNNQDQDCGAGSYNSSLPALSFADLYCSYSTNEITTYWNSPFVYLTAALEHYTENVTFTEESYIRIKNPMLEIDAPFYDAGDTLTLTWTASSDINTVDLEYKVYGSDTFIPIAQGLDASAGEFPGFVLPDLPGDSLLIRVRDAEREDTPFNMAVVSIKPTSSLAITDVVTWRSGFTPGNRVSISWTFFQVDTTDLYYRLSSSDDDILILEDIPTSILSYSSFRIPDAPGDTLTFKVVDSNDPTIFGLSEPFLIAMNTSGEDETDMPDRFELAQNYPNPFNPSTQIDYSLPETTQVRLEVMNSTGQQVAMLVNQRQSAGNYSLNFDASGLSSGVYFYSMIAGSFQETRKMLLVK